MMGKMKSMIKQETEEQHINALKERVYSLLGDNIRLSKENGLLRAGITKGCEPSCNCERCTLSREVLRTIDEMYAS